MLGDAVSIPGWGTKIPYAVMQPKDKKINKIKKKKEEVRKQVSG